MVKQKRKCSSCGNVTERVYNFPSNPVVKEKWKDALGLSEVRSGDKVCYLHFKDTDFQGRGLKRCGVIPSMNIDIVEQLNNNADINPPMPNDNNNNNGNEIVTDHGYAVNHTNQQNLQMLLDKISKLETALCKSESEVKRLKKLNGTLKTRVGFYRQKYVEIASGKLLPKKTQNSIVSNKLSGKYSKAQISVMLSDKKRQQGSEYSKADFRFALHMSQKQSGGSALEFLRKSGKLQLPALNTTRRKFSWIHSIPGELKPIVHFIKAGKKIRKTQQQQT